jgi:2-oxoglutarate ferredoxin oxidoreductase subunit beta
MHDGSLISLNKIAQDWDPMNRRSAMEALRNAKEKGEILTGLLYINEESKDLHQTLKTTYKPLNELGRKDLCPGSSVLAEINAELR